MTTALPPKDYVDKVIQTVFGNSSKANSRGAIAGATGGSALDSDQLSTVNRGMGYFVGSNRGVGNDGDCV